MYKIFNVLSLSPNENMLTAIYYNEIYVIKYDSFKILFYDKTGQAIDIKTAYGQLKIGTLINCSIQNEYEYEYIVDEIRII